MRTIYNEPDFSAKRDCLDWLRRCAEHFRKGEDQKGLTAFLEGIGNLAALSLDPSDAERLLPAAESLLRCVNNKDAAGMTDVVEHLLCPALTEGIT